MTDLHTTQSDRHTLQSPSDDGRLATPAEVAEFFRTTTGKLANDRVLGRGPKFVRFNRKILYRWSDVHDFVAQQIRQRTDDPPQHSPKPVVR